LGIIDSKSLLRYRAQAPSISDKADALSQNESLAEVQHENQFLFIDPDAVGFGRLCGGANNGDDHHNNTASHNDGSSPGGSGNPTAATGSR
jgi:hypothetical protein